MRERLDYAYKLVLLNSGTKALESLFVPYGAVHSYAIGKWTRARFGGLLVFKSMKDVRTFVCDNSICLLSRSYKVSRLKLFRVACKNPIELPCARFSCSQTVAFDSPAWLKALWGNKVRRWSSVDTLDGWPKGTSAYKEVRPIREVKCKFDLDE
jgi:hypothetical protein